MRDINNYTRSYAKGKSFEFTEWSKLNNYTNSGIKQDFVTYGGSLYACICDVAAGNESPDKDTTHWKLAVQGNDWIDNSIEITYDDLKNKRDCGELIPGQKYRIVDYASSSWKEWTFAYPFDIIVTAISSSKLSSVASALHREGVSSELDNYDLSTWKLKYSLDNDSSKFDWANEKYGTGVIYYMEDEFGNQASYDFYSISPEDGSHSPSCRHLFPWPYTGKSYNNLIKSQMDSDGRLTIPNVYFEEDIDNIEVSQNSNGKLVAYNKANLFSTTIFDSEPANPSNPSNPYNPSNPELSNPYAKSNEVNTVNEAKFYIGEI